MSRMMSKPALGVRRGLVGVILGEARHEGIQIVGVGGVEQPVEQQLGTVVIA